LPTTVVVIMRPWNPHLAANMDKVIDYLFELDDDHRPTDIEISKALGLSMIEVTAVLEYLHEHDCIELDTYDGAKTFDDYAKKWER